MRKPLPPLFAVQGVNGRWFAVAPRDHVFDRRELDAADLAALQGDPAIDESRRPRRADRRRCAPESYPADVPGRRRRARLVIPALSERIFATFKPFKNPA